jgi:hypothetical protein
MERLSPTSVEPFQRLPDSAAAQSMFGFRENQHRWAESFAYVHTGDHRAEAALGSARALYPLDALAPRADLALIHAIAQTNDREIDAGLQPALDTLRDHTRGSSGGRLRDVPGTRPDRMRTDKAYSSRANRAYLRNRGIGVTTPPKDDRLRYVERGSPAGRRRYRGCPGRQRRRPGPVRCSSRRWGRGSGLLRRGRTDDGTSRSPASSGDSPWHCCRNRVTNR